MRVRGRRRATNGAESEMAWDYCEGAGARGMEEGWRREGDDRLSKAFFVSVSVSPALALEGRFWAGGAAATTFCATSFLCPIIAMPPLPPPAPLPAFVGGGTGFLDPNIISSLLLPFSPPPAPAHLRPPQRSWPLPPFRWRRGSSKPPTHGSLGRVPDRVSAVSEGCLNCWATNNA